MRILCISSTRASISNVRPEGEWFIGLQRGGAKVTVLTEADSEYADRFRAAGMRVVDFHSKGKFDKQATADISSELDGIDIVFAMTNKTIANAVFAMRNSAAKLVSYRGQTGNISRWNPGCYLTHLNPRIDAIICVAEAVRSSIAQHLRNPDKAVAIYKGHDPAWYNIEALPLSELGIHDDHTRVVCVSNYRPRKGIESLIDAFAHLNTPTHLILVGSGMDNPGLRKRALRHIDSDHYHPLGFRADTLAITAAADIAVLPALRREGLPKTVIEAMACAVTPVVTDTGGNAELVIDGESGLVVPPGSPAALAKAIQQLIDHPDKRKAMAKNAKARIATHFRTEDTAKKTLELFNQLLSSKD